MAKPTDEAKNRLILLPAAVFDWMGAWLTANDLLRCRSASRHMQTATDGCVARARSILVDLRAAESADLAALIFVAKCAALLCEFSVTDVHDYNYTGAFADTETCRRCMPLFARIIAANRRTLQRVTMPAYVGGLQPIVAATVLCPNLREWTSALGSHVGAVARNCTALEKLRLLSGTSHMLSDFKCQASLTDLDVTPPPTTIADLSPFTSLVVLRMKVPLRWKFDLDAFSATVAPLVRLRSLHLTRDIEDTGPIAEKHRVCGTLNVPSLRVLILADQLCGLLGADQIACPLLEEWAGENGSLIFAMAVARSAPSLRSIVCGGAFGSAAVAAFFGAPLEGPHMRGVKRLVVPCVVLNSEALVCIGTQLLKLTHLEFNIVDHDALEPFCRLVARRMIGLRIRSALETPGPERNSAVVMETLQTLDIDEFQSREAAFLRLPALTTLHARSDHHVHGLLAHCPRLEHCSLIDMTGPRLGSPIVPRESKVLCPLVTQLFVGADYMPIAEIERALAMFPAVQWLSVCRTCSDDCAGEYAIGSDAQVCEDPDDHPKQYLRMGAGCREQVLRRATRLMPHLRELFVGTHKNIRPDHAEHVSVTLLRELGLAESLPKYSDELEGSTALRLADVRRPWN